MSGFRAQDFPLVLELCAIRAIARAQHSSEAKFKPLIEYYVGRNNTTIAQHFKPAMNLRFGAALLGGADQIADEMQSADITRRRVRDASYAVFREAHRPLCKYTALLKLDTELTVATAASSVGAFLQRYYTHVVGL
jgi:hypothetical protein